MGESLLIYRNLSKVISWESERGFVEWFNPLLFLFYKLMMVDIILKYNIMVKILGEVDT